MSHNENGQDQLECIKWKGQSLTQEKKKNELGVIIHEAMRPKDIIHKIFGEIWSAAKYWNVISLFGQGHD